MSDNFYSMFSTEQLLLNNKWLQNSYKYSNFISSQNEELQISTIKKETGKTAKYWIDERIVYDAKTVLTSSDMAIEILAEELGFNSVSNFSNFFKTKTNLSPSEYRTKYKFFFDNQS